MSYYVDWRAGDSGPWNQVDPATSPTSLTGLTNGTQVCVAVYTRIEGRGTPLRDPVVCVTPDDDNRPDNLSLTPGDSQVKASWSPVIGAEPTASVPRPDIGTPPHTGFGHPRSHRRVIRCTLAWWRTMYLRLAGSPRGAGSSRGTDELEDCLPIVLLR